MLFVLLVDLYTSNALSDLFFIPLVVVVVLGLGFWALSAHVDKQFEREPEPEVPTTPPAAATLASWEEEQYYEQRSPPFFPE